MTRNSILKPGYNCWRIERTRRAAFVVDGAAYFKAFREAAARARHTVLMLGWDIDSRVPLVRDEDADKLPNRLCDFLNAVVSRPNGPHAYVLTWDFAMLYALDREWLPLYKLDWRTHRRLHFRMDDNHPPGGSHHQKVVVIDDAVAFSGGLDLTKARWDTPEHRVDDPRRIELDSKTPYRPFHDVQMLVDGDAARSLGDLVRARWQRATGRYLTATPHDVVSDPWPASVPVEIENARVAIVRTEPLYKGYAEVREVELLYLDAIHAARRFIYIENQFFTAKSIGDVLAQRLAEPEGPEIVMVLARRTDGWLSQRTMDVLRTQLVERLRAADRFGRFRVYYPDLPGLEPQCINVHAKVMIVDDEFVRVGSSNLNNRSMGIDTECDLALEAEGVEQVRTGIAHFRCRLLAEHLGVAPHDVGRAMTENKSLIGAVESLIRPGRTLKPLDVVLPNGWIPDSDLVDPERPLDPDKIAQQFVPPEERESTHRRMVGGVSILLALLAVAAAWRWTPLKDWLDVNVLADYVAAFRNYPAAPLLVVGAYLVGSLVMIPVTLMVVVTGLAFGPFLGFFYALAGTLVSSVALYAVGSMLGRHTVRRLAGSRLNRLSRRLGQRGITTMIVVRVLPLAPFTVVNIVAGASHIRFRDYLLGTVVGMVPGMAAIVFFVDRVGATVQKPSLQTSLILAAVVAVIGLGAYWLRKWVTQRDKVDGAPQSVA